MGYCINKDSKGNDLPVSGKFDALVKSGDAKPAFPIPFSDIPSGKAFLCVVDNGMFDAVAYAYSESELKYFLRDDGRFVLWLEMDKELAERLSDYPVVYHDGMKYNPEHPEETVEMSPLPHSSTPRERKPKKKVKKNSFRANYCKGYAIINGEVKEAKPKTPVKK